MVLRGTRRVVLWGNKTYLEKVLSIQRSSLIAYWPLTEGGGSVADNAEGTAARDGAYTGVELANTAGPGASMGLAGLWDGTSDYVNIYSASLNSAFNNSELTVACWCKVANAGVWTDGLVRRAVVLRASVGNRVLLFRSNANNTAGVQYIAAGIASTVTFNNPTLNWFHLAITVSKSNDRMKCYLNGLQSGATQTGLTVWTGALETTGCFIGANTNTPTEAWSGYLAHCAVWSSELTASEVALLAVAV